MLCYVMLCYVMLCYVKKNIFHLAMLLNKSGMCTNVLSCLIETEV